MGNISRRLRSCMKDKADHLTRLNVFNIYESLLCIIDKLFTDNVMYYIIYIYNYNIMHKYYLYYIIYKQCDNYFIIYNYNIIHNKLIINNK